MDMYNYCSVDETATHLSSMTIASTVIISLATILFVVTLFIIGIALFVKALS